MRALAWTLLLVGCAPAAPLPRSPHPAPIAPSVPAAAASAPAAQAPPSAPEPPAEPTCPDEMALVRRVQGPFCIDRWEGSIVVVSPDGKETPWPGNHTLDRVADRVRAVSVQGQKPQGYISGEQAARACARSGKRLCEIDEWVRACKGPRLTLYPYGNSRQPKKCNDRFKVLDHHPVVRLFDKYAPAGTPRTDMWLPSWMNDPRLHEYDHTVSPTGAFDACTNDYGVYDMVGNLHEWVNDPAGTFFGGFFMDTFQNGEGCEYRTLGHPFDYHDYSTGFRCCADASGSG
jgi:formylglycine-generating enzyme